MCFSCARNARQIDCGHAEPKKSRATLLEVTFSQHLVISQKTIFQRNGMHKRGKKTYFFLFRYFTGFHKLKKKN